MTVTAMCREMDHFELTQWAALDAVRNQEAEKADRLAKKGMRGR